MAQRRMFSVKITSSARFLKMPLEAQALYFHLVQNADDDGVVEGFSVMRLIGSSEDALKLLAYKGYIEILNEDLVLFVLDWLEHNKIRADRKVDSIYKNLLTEKMPKVQLIEAKTRSDRNKNCEHGTSQGQPKDSQGTEEVRLGKVSVVKDSLGKVSGSIENPFTFYNNNIQPITQHIVERINSFLEDGVTQELMLRYFQIAVERGKTNWSYIQAMAQNNLNKGVKTIAQFEHIEREYQKSVLNKKTGGSENGGNQHNTESQYERDSRTMSAEELAKKYKWAGMVL